MPCMYVSMETSFLNPLKVQRLELGFIINKDMLMTLCSVIEVGKIVKSSEDTVFSLICSYLSMKNL